MRKLLCAVLALIMLFSLAGCGLFGKKPVNDEDITGETVTDSEKPQDDTESPKPSEDTDSKPEESPAASEKPSEKPNASSKPSEKPTATPKPSEKPAPTPTPAPSEKPELTISDVLSSIYYGTADLPSLGTTSVSSDLFKNYLFIDYIDGAQAMASEALIGSIAHSVVVLKVPSGTDAATTAASVKANANPRKWICVEAEKVIVRSSGSWVLLVMTDAANADIIAANFDYLMSQK